MKPIFSALLIFTCLLTNAQVDRVRFDYDIAGNQTLRFLCMGCAQSKTNTNDFSELLEEDLLKFFPNDVISYYPNPVSEELYLKWELVNENKVSQIKIYSINGQLVKLYNGLEKENSKIIPFQELSIGTYSILLSYTNGEQKSITIVKK